MLRPWPPPPFQRRGAQPREKGLGHTGRIPGSSALWAVRLPPGGRGRLGSPAGGQGGPGALNRLLPTPPVNGQLAARRQDSVETGRKVEVPAISQAFLSRARPTWGCVPMSGPATLPGAVAAHLSNPASLQGALPREGLGSPGQCPPQVPEALWPPIITSGPEFSKPEGRATLSKRRQTSRETPKASSLPPLGCRVQSSLCWRGWGRPAVENGPSPSGRSCHTNSEKVSCPPLPSLVPPTPDLTQHGERKEG